MIVVTVDLHSALTHQKTRLGKMIIANTGDGNDPKRGDYRAYVGNKTHAIADDDNAIMWHPQREGLVKDYPRLAYNVWRLVVRSLLSAFPEEHRTPSRSQGHDTFALLVRDYLDEMDADMREIYEIDLRKMLDGTDLS